MHYNGLRRRVCDFSRPRRWAYSPIGHNDLVNPPKYLFETVRPWYLLCCLCISYGSFSRRDSWACQSRVQSEVGSDSVWPIAVLMVLSR